MSASATNRGAVCPRCAAPLPRAAPCGLCPECLLLGGLENDEDLDAASGNVVDVVAPREQASGDVPESLRAFGDYELLEQIAVGGMGVVFKARQRSLNRLVAVKMIRAGRLAREADIRRFQTEAEAAANLQHPHIVAIHEVGEHEGRHFFSMDYIEGRTLAEAARGQPLEPARAARLIQTIAEAIAYAHGRGVLHRDLKPGNVLLDAEGQPHVADFGLAKLLEGDSELTQTGAVLGSPSYMSPEQARGRGEQVSVRSDVYALGAMLYELLTTRPPFLAATPLETMKLVAESDPVAPRALNPSVPRDLETICLKCLQKEPGRRYATAQELADELGRFLVGDPIQARPGTVWERAWKWTCRHPARAALAALAMITPSVVITVLVVMGGKLTRERNHARQQEQNASAAAVRAEVGEQAARERAYAADIYAAFQALAVDDLAMARRLLNEHRPRAMTNDDGRMTNGVAAAISSSSRGDEAHFKFGTFGTRNSEPGIDQSSLMPAATNTDLRGFEWRVLWERTRGQEAFAFTNLSRPAECLAFAPDGRNLAAGGVDGIYLWDIAERRPLGLFPSPNPIPTLPHSPTAEDLRPMLDASPAVVEHLKAYPPVLDYLDTWAHTNQTRRVDSLAFTSDGKHLLVGGWDCVRSWEWATRAFEFAIPERKSIVATPAFGDLFVVANNETINRREEAPSAHPQSALVYSFTGRRLVAELPGYGRRVVVSPDGQYVAAVSRTNGTVLWQPATGKTQRLSQDPRWYDPPLYGVLPSFSPDGKMLFLGSDTGRPPVLWDTKSKQVKASLRNERIHVAAVAWSPDGRRLAGGGENRTIGLWKTSPESIPEPALDGPPFLSPESVLHGHEAAITALAFSPDSRWLVSAAKDRSIRLWAISEASAPVPKAKPDTFEEYAPDPETGCLVARAGGKLTLWDPQRHHGIRTMAGTERHFHAGFLAQGRGFVAVEMATNDVPAFVEIRRLPEGDVQMRREILPAPPPLQSQGDQSAAWAVASPDGQWLAVPQRAGTGNEMGVHIFAIPTGQFVTRLPRRRLNWLPPLRTSPDGRWLVRFALESGTNWIALYDAQTWQLKREIVFYSTGGGNEMEAAAVDPTSRFLATGSRAENSLRIWELRSGRLVGHCNGGVRGFFPVWSRDSRTLLVRDGESLRLWSMVVFRELAALPLDWHNTYLPLGFTADSRTLALYTLGREVVSWSPPTLEEIDRAP